MAIRQSSGGEWENEPSADFLCGEQHSVTVPEVGRPPLAPGTAKWVATGIYNWSAVDNRFSRRATLNGIQFRQNTPISRGGPSSSQPVFGSDPTYLYMWHVDDGDLKFAQHASISGHVAQQWKLRTLAPGGGGPGRDAEKRAAAPVGTRRAT